MWLKCGWDVADIWLTCGWHVAEMWMRYGWDEAEMWMKCGWDVDEMADVWLICDWHVAENQSKNVTDWVSEKVTTREAIASKMYSVFSGVRSKFYLSHLTWLPQCHTIYFGIIQYTIPTIGLGFVSYDNWRSCDWVLSHRIPPNKLTHHYWLLHPNRKGDQSLTLRPPASC